MYIKKVREYAERDEQKRQDFLEKLCKLDSSKIVYLDETGIEQQICREYGWVEKGQTLPLAVSGKRKRRINLIAGLLNGKLIEPMTFEGSCNKQLIETYFKDVLLPALGAGFTIILDNASFHKSKALADIVVQHGCILLFLPPYSPDFNPIEHYWAALKQNIKNIRRSVYDIHQAISQALL